MKKKNEIKLINPQNRKLTNFQPIQNYQPIQPVQNFQPIQPVQNLQPEQNYENYRPRKKFSKARKLRKRKKRRKLKLKKKRRKRKLNTAAEEFIGDFEKSMRDTSTALLSINKKLKSLKNNQKDLDKRLNEDLGGSII